MSDPIKRDGLAPKFWEKKPLEDLDKDEWEALCDGCGRCCLLKLEDPDTAEVEFTNVVCRIFDAGSCQCGNYPLRKQLVPDCVIITPENIERIAHWMPASCAYRMLFEGKELHDWHPLITGDPETVHTSHVSMRDKVIMEYEVHEDDLEDYIIEGMI